MGQLSRIRFYYRLVSIYRSASSYEHDQYTYLFHSIKLFAQRRSAPGRCEMAFPPNKADPSCTVQSLNCCFGQEQLKSHLQARLTGRVGWCLVVQHSCDGSLIRQDKTCWIPSFPPQEKCRVSWRYQMVAFPLSSFQWKAHLSQPASHNWCQ